MSATDDFVEFAERYCTLIETGSGDEPFGFLGRVERVLTKLCNAAAKLPNVAPESEDSPGIDRTHSTEFAERFAELERLLGPLDRYESEGYERSISADLLDIYFDLVSDLRYMRSGAAPSDVLWQWRFSFTTHWGPNHAEGALQAIRALVGPT